MAFQKQIRTNAGYDAQYWRLTEWHVNRLKQGGEVIATFRPYRDKAAADGGAHPASDQVAKLRLSDDSFTRYFGGNRDQAKTDQQIIYEAAAAEGVTSDFGDFDESTKRRALFKSAAKV